MSHPTPASLSIGSVERETGLSKDTLRVWERRYRFPSPARDAAGERIYPPDQVEKLRLIKSLMDRGHRPGKLVGAELGTLRGMASQPANLEATMDDEVDARHDLSGFVALCKAHQMDELRREFNQCLLRMGMFRFVTEVIAPLTSLVGTEWASGKLAVFEEHLYTECVQAVMRNAIASMPAASAPHNTVLRPRIVLTTVPHEPHGLGLLMAEAIFTLEGAHCISLGVQTPVGEIVRAAATQAADIVALSFSASVRPAYVLQALGDLRAALQPGTEIWAGGRCMVPGRQPAGVVRHMGLHGIPGALAAWRSRCAPA
jgi:methanogenic corrinoid protein MtbC1